MPSYDESVAAARAEAEAYHDQSPDERPDAQVFVGRVLALCDRIDVLHELADAFRERVAVLEGLLTEAEAVLKHPGMWGCWHPTVSSESTGGGDIREQGCGDCPGCEATALLERLRDVLPVKRQEER